MMLKKAIWIVAFFCSLAPAHAGVRHGIVTTYTFPTVFTGSPLATVTSIDTSGGFTCSRLTAVVPAAVQCSPIPSVIATGTRADGSTFSAFQDLEYVWDFGDPAGGQIFTRPTDGATVNANSDQVAPNAAYVYTVPGSYTITMRVRGKNGSGYVVGNPVIATFTASDYTGLTVRYADSNAVCAPSCLTGLIGDPYNTKTLINTYVGTGNDKVLYVKRGSSWTGDGVSFGPWQNAGAVASSRMRIYPYGVGVNAVWDVSSGTSNAFRISNPAPPSKSDLTITGMDFSNSGTNTGDAIVNIAASTGKTLTDVYITDATVTNTITTSSRNNITMQPGSGGALSKIGLWNVTVTGPTVVDATVQQTGAFFVSDAWSFIVGGSYVGGTGSNDRVRDHHIYPDGASDTLFQWINFGAGPNRNYCLNGNTVGNSNGTRWVVSENNCTSVQRAFDNSNGNNEIVTKEFTDVVIQRNAEQNLTGASFNLFYSVASRTERDNRMWGNTGNGWQNPDGGQASKLNMQIYRNKVYVGSGNTPSADAGNGTFELLDKYPQSGGTYTFTNGSSNILAPSGSSSYPVGLPLKFAGSPPLPFVAGTQYYVKTNDSPALTATITVTTGAGGIGATVGPAVANGTSTNVTTSWIRPQSFAYNTMVDARATGVAHVIWTFADQVAAGSYVDFNSYYSVAGQTNMFRDNATAKSFAQWQAAPQNWDTNGSVLGANPWPNNGGVPAQWSDMN